MTKKRYRKLMTAWAHKFIAKYPMQDGMGGALLKGVNRIKIEDQDYGSYQEAWDSFMRAREDVGMQ